MALLDSLCTDIMREVFSCMDVYDVLQVDSAVCVCQGELSEYVFDYSNHFGKENTRKGALFYKPEFYEWILLRGARLSSLASFPNCDVGAFLAIIRTSGPFLKTVKTHMDFDVVEAALYTHCAMLEKLECGKVGKRGGSLNRLLKACPSLQHLAFGQINASVLKVLQKFGWQIRSLRMASSDEQQRLAWADLVPHLKNLTELEIGKGAPIGVVLAAVGQHCPHLRALSVTSSVDWVGNSGFATMQSVVAHCLDLERLHFGCGIALSNEEWLVLLEKCNGLTALHLEGYVIFSSEEVASALGRFSELRELVMKSWVGGGIFFEDHVAKWPLLEVLNISNESIDDNVLYALRDHCPKLRTFIAADCREVTAAGVEALMSACSQLQHVELLHCGEGISIAKLEAITAHCHHLEVLNFRPQDSSDVISLR